MDCEIKSGERMVKMRTEYTLAELHLFKSMESRALRREVQEKDLRWRSSQGNEINCGDKEWSLGQKNREFKQKVPRVR